MERLKYGTPRRLLLNILYMAITEAQVLVAFQLMEISLQQVVVTQWLCSGSQI